MHPHKQATEERAPPSLHSLLWSPQSRSVCIETKSNAITMSTIAPVSLPLLEGLRCRPGASEAIVREALTRLKSTRRIARWTTARWKQRIVDNEQTQLHQERSNKRRRDQATEKDEERQEKSRQQSSFVLIARSTMGTLDFPSAAVALITCTTSGTPCASQGIAGTMAASRCSRISCGLACSA